MAGKRKKGEIIKKKTEDKWAKCGEQGHKIIKK